MEASILSFLWNEREQAQNSCDVILILDGKQSMAHSLVLKPSCGLFKTTTLAQEKVEDKQMTVVDIDQLLKVDSLAKFCVAERVEAFETILQFLYGQEPEISSAHMAEAVLLTSHFIMCDKAFERASLAFDEHVTEMSDAIRVFSFVVHNCDVDTAAFLRESVKEKVAANIARYLDPGTDAYKEIFFLDSNTLKSLLENVDVSDKNTLNQLLLVDGSEYSKRLLELDFEVISVWWKTKEMKAFRDDQKKFDFAIAWVSRRTARRSLFHIFLARINITTIRIFKYREILNRLVPNNKSTQNMVLISTLFTAKRADSTSFLVKYILDAVAGHTSASTRLLHSWNPNDATKRAWTDAVRVQVEEGDPFTVRFAEDAAEGYIGIRGKIGYTTGCHVFRVVWLEEERGNSPRIGVAETYAALHEGIGGNEKSYGWSLVTRDIYHRDKKLNQYKPQDYAIPEGFFMVIDSRRGAFGFAEVSGEYLGDAATGLDGKTLYVACSCKTAAKVTVMYIGSIGL